MLLSGFCLGVIAVMFMIIARDFRHLVIAKVVLALLVAVSAFLLRDIVPLGWYWLMGDLMTCIPALFWLVCQLGFTRRPRLFSVWSILALYTCITPALSRPFGAPLESAGLLHWLAWELPRAAEYLVILNGLWIVVAHWQDDLIESRRHLRILVLCTMGLTALWSTLAMNTGYLPEISLNGVVAVAALVSGYVFLKGRDGIFSGIHTTPREVGAADTLSTADLQPTDLKTIRPPTPPAPGPSPLERLNQCMNDGYYRTAKLTLKMLARELDLPEYRTRALINEAFDYRNFNDYINHLRINEASSRLLAEPGTPIQNIALDAGYRTLSSFNRAFREIRGCTPSDYRQHIQTSQPTSEETDTANSVLRSKPV